MNRLTRAKNEHKAGQHDYQWSDASGQTDFTVYFAKNSCFFLLKARWKISVTIIFIDLLSGGCKLRI